jgi:hypothetical protein
MGDKRSCNYVYVVWGPDPQLGDGVGVLGYATSLRKAQAILRWEREYEREYGPRSWLSVKDCGVIERVPAEELGWLGDEPLYVFVERLNESLVY